MSDLFTPAQTGFSRVFLIPGRARPDHPYSYESCHRMTGVSQEFGEVTAIECPDPYNLDNFIEIGEVGGEISRVTTALEGRYAADIKSALLEYARRRLDVDVQLHIGAAENPANFYGFQKSLILEKARIIGFETEDLGALSSDERSAITETGNVSAREMYEVVPLECTAKANDLITNEVLDVVIADSPSQDSDGASKIFAITKAAGGSPSTPPDVLYSRDKGATWYAEDIDTLTSSDDPSAVARVGQYLVVVSNADESLSYAPLSEFVPGTDPTFTKVTAGFVASKGPNAVAAVGNRAFIVGDGGYVYISDDITSGVTVVDAGVLTISDLNDVAAISKSFAVAVGDAGVILKTEDGESWSLVPSPVGGGVDLLTVAVKNKMEWFVGGSNGRLYYTIDGGDTWQEKGFPSSGTGTVQDVVISKDSVIYLSHTTAAGRGRVLRSTCGGYEWIVLPEEAGVMPASDRFNRLAANSYDPNLVVAVGLHDNASDGIVVVCKK